ncbi:MAG: response regulator transcription factor [Holosporales bacterium]|jgi:two-component system phosphate regulon response regulator OmpR|nr:response regulator transcription factor [Holosporales bacterium]
MTSILIVDDDARLLFLIASVLKTHSYEVVGAKSASEAKNLLLNGNFDIVIVDWMMPNETGIDFIKSIRNSATYISNIPVIMLTAVDNIDSKIVGFESGVDDYVVKPFETRELVVRIKALLNRTQKESVDEIIKFEDCEFSQKTDELTMNGELIYLSTTELILLKTLCSKPNQPFSRAELAKKLSFQVSDRTIDVQITRLRKKIGDNSKNPRIIKTVRYIGYALNVI